MQLLAAPWRAKPVTALEAAVYTRFLGWCLAAQGEFWRTASGGGYLQSGDGWLFV